MYSPPLSDLMTFTLFPTSFSRTAIYCLSATFVSLFSLKGMVQDFRLKSSFSGTPSQVRLFKLRLTQYVGAMPQIYATAESQILFAGHLLEGLAADWYYSLVDPATFRVPPTYTLLSFLQELEDFFGGRVTLQHLERSLITLRQTGTVSELAIQFQSITNAFRPRWPDYPLIFFWFFGFLLRN